MSEQNNFKMDDLIRKRVEGASMPVSDQLWQRILDARKGRKIHPYGWIGFASLVILTSAVAGWMTYEDSQMATPTPEPITASIQENEGDNDTSQTDHSTFQEYQDNYQTEQNALSSSDSDNDHQAASTTSENSALTPSSSRADQGEEVSPSKSASKSVTSKKKAASSSSASLNKKDTASSSNKKDNASSSSTSNQAESEATQRLTQPTSEVSGEADHASATTRDEQEETALLSSNEADYPLISEDSNEDQPLLTAPLSSKFLKKARPTCYSFNSFLRGLSVDAYLSPEYAVRQLVYKNDDMIDYAALRNDTESYSFAFSAGFRANAHFQGGLALRTGVVYTDIVEKIRYSDPDAEERSVITVSIDTIYDGPNVIISVDTLSIVTYGEQELIGYNRYRFYDVPIMIGYEIDRGRWIIHINTGLMLNIGTSRRGSILDPESNLVSINSTNANSYPAFRKKVGSSLLMSMGFNYAIRPKVHLMVEPQFRVWTKPLNIQEYPVDQKYINFGLAMGVRQYF